MGGSTSVARHSNARPQVNFRFSHWVRTSGILCLEGERTTHMGNWLDCVRTNNPKALNTPVETGHRSATVCHLANLAMELGRPLKWDPDKEQFVDDAQPDRDRWRPGRAPWNV